MTHVPLNFAIRYQEAQGNLYGAALTRQNVASMLAQAGRLPDALAYAQAAVQNFETFGPGAEADVAKTRDLIAEIEEKQRTKAQ